MKAYRFAVIMILALVVCSTISLSQEEQSRKSDKQKKGNPVVIMKTSMGTIKVELYPDKAPITVKNFLSYVNEKFYDNTVFHRVIKNFMVQGGGFTSTDPIKQKKVKDPIKIESDNGLKNDKGTIAMARTNDPNSATSQFFINVVDNAFLNFSPGNPGYTVFGRVIEGMDVVDRIREVKTGNSQAIARSGDKEIPTTFQDVPQTKVIIETIRRVESQK